MKKTLILFMVIGLNILPAMAQNGEKSLKDIAATAGKAMGMVRCTVSDETGTRSMIGTGVCLNPNGLMMTTAMDSRVQVEKITKIEVLLPGAEGKTLAAKLLSIEPLTGLSFIQVTDAHTFSTVGFHRTSRLSLGDRVMSVGLSLTDAAWPVTAGMGYVSSFRRTPGRLVLVTGGCLGDMGSVVFNAQGEAIGLVSGQPYLRYQTLTQRGEVNMPLRSDDRTVSFIPVEEFIYAFDNITQDGQVRRLPWIGVGRFAPVRSDLAEAKGITGSAVMIDSVIPGRPADKAGLKNRDLIIGIDGKPLEQLATPELVAGNVARRLMKYKTGKTVSLRIKSGDQALRDVTVALEPMPKLASEAMRLFNRTLGLLLREKVTLDRYDSSNPTADMDGLLVLAVGPRTPSANAGLEVGDLVTSINGKAADTVDRAKEIIDAAFKQTPPMDLRLVIKRGTATETLVIKAPK